MSDPGDSRDRRIPRDPRIQRDPRPSDTWSARPAGPPTGDDPRERDALNRDALDREALGDLLDAFARSTDIRPAPDLARRIHATISREPARTPPRRFLAAILALRPGAARDAFRQLAGVAVGRGRFPAVVRVQALALVALTVAGLGMAAVGGAVGIVRMVESLEVDHRPEQQLLHSPTPPPLASMSPARPTDARPTDARRSAPPTPEATPRASDEPPATETATQRPPQTKAPVQTKAPRQTDAPRATKRPDRDDDDRRKTEEPDDRDDRDDRDDDDRRETEEPDDRGDGDDEREDPGEGD